MQLERSSLRLSRQLLLFQQQSRHKTRNDGSLLASVPDRHMSSVKHMNAAQYCLDSVRKQDYENFLATLLLPNSCRSDVLAIRAFNIELSQIGVTTTREPLAGLMRLEFWREALTAVFEDRPARQPVAQSLHRAVLKHKLSKRWLRQLIDSREQLINKPRFDSTAELETYTEASNSAIYYLTLQAAGVSSVDADHCASHLGKGEGILRAVRGIPFLANKRQVLLPRQLLAEHGVSEEDVLRGCREQRLKDAVYSLASLANQHIQHARDLGPSLPSAARLALLPAVSAASVLRRLQLADFDAFEPSLQTRNTWLPAQLWWASFRRRL